MACVHGRPVYKCSECAAAAYNSGQRQVAWLVELKPGTISPTYYGETDEGVLGWTGDHLLAVRFAREQDAQLVIDCEGFTEARAVEHAWG